MGETDGGAGVNSTRFGCGGWFGSAGKGSDGDGGVGVEDGEMVVEKAAVGGHSTDKTRFSKLHTHRRRSNSNHRSMAPNPKKKPRALMPTDAADWIEQDFYRPNPDERFLNPPKKSHKGKTPN